MNLVKYLFKDKEKLESDLLLGPFNISYKDMLENIKKVAGILRQYKEQKIVLLGENSDFWIYSYFGIIGSNNICVPINPQTPDEDISDIISRVNPKAVFLEEKSNSKIMNIIHSKNIKKIFPKEIIKYSDSLDLIDINGDKEAVIIFTSGSSGKPKGVVLTHKNIIANTNSIIRYLNLSKKDIIETVLPFSYCYGTSLLHTHIKVGGKLVINNSFMMVNKVISDLKEHKCTGFAGVPTHFEILIKYSNFLNENFPDLRYLTQAGGKMRDETILKIYNKINEKNIKLFIMYGQTEATARLSYLPPEDLPKKIGSIGKGIPGVKLKVVDKNRKSILPGEIGEIIAKGENIMKGYYLNELATKEKIKDNWLYTNDLATIDSESYIYLKGRSDEIVKVGGVRVNTLEIKEKIMGFEFVDDCYITVIKDDLMGLVIASVIAPKKNKEEIIKKLKRNLSSYQFPKKMIFVDKIPTTNSGKINRKEIEALIENA